MAKKLTIIDIAKIAGVSPSAVSFALNNRKGISDETRKRILAIVEKHNFVPNEQARRLLFNRTNNIGIIQQSDISPLNNLFLHDIMNSAAGRCDEIGYNLLFTSIGHKQRNTVPDIIRKKEVDGVLILGEADPALIENISEMEFSMVLIDEHMRTTDAYAVEANYLQGSELAAQFLIDGGHQKIAYMGESNRTQYGRQTYNGFKSALADAGLKPAVELVYQKVRRGDPETGYRAMNMLIKAGAPSAVFCSADIYALGAIRCLSDNGLQVPDDVSVIAMDNIILSNYISPGLTTVDFKKEKMGRAAVDLLLQLCEGALPVEKKIVFNGEVVHRQSVMNLSDEGRKKKS